MKRGISESGRGNDVLKPSLDVAFFPDSERTIDDDDRISNEVSWRYLLKLKWNNRVTMMVRDYVLLTLLLKFHNLGQLLFHFCQICSCQSRIGQTVEQQNLSQQNLVSDHQSHPVLWWWKQREFQNDLALGRAAIAIPQSQVCLHSSAHFQGESPSTKFSNIPLRKDSVYRKM